MPLLTRDPHKNTESIDCLILAAGGSTRMGRWKMMLPFGTSTVVETVVAAALGVCSRVVLVIGHESDRLRELFAHDRRVVPVENRDWRSGMFSSVKRGVSEIRSRRFFLGLADMPLVDSAVYEALLAWDGDSIDNRICIPVFSGKRGHPLLLHRDVIEEIRHASDETTTMKDVVGRFPVHEMPWHDAGILHDLDTPDDYRRLRRNGPAG